LGALDEHDRVRRLQALEADRHLVLAGLDAQPGHVVDVEIGVLDDHGSAGEVGQVAELVVLEKLAAQVETGAAEEELVVGGRVVRVVLIVRIVAAVEVDSPGGELVAPSGDWMKKLCRTPRGGLRKFFLPATCSCRVSLLAALDRILELLDLAVVLFVGEMVCGCGRRIGRVGPDGQRGHDYSADGNDRPDAMGCGTHEKLLCNAYLRSSGQPRMVAVLTPPVVG
jgi:hypothetical protein